MTPDLKWRWKDEELTAGWIDAGVYTAVEVVAIRETGLRVIADVEARRFPFDGSWLEWRPDPTWATPETPPGWDLVGGYDLPLSTGRRLRGVDPRLPPASVTEGGDGGRVWSRPPSPQPSP